MPLHVTVEIDSLKLGQVHIGQLEELANDEQTITYIAWVGEFHDFIDPNNSAQFEHKYDDGALVCIRKALSALENRGIDLPGGV